MRKVADYRQFKEQVAEYGDIGKEAINRSIEKFARKKRLRKEDINNLKLIASTGIFATAVLVGTKGHGNIGQNKRLKPIKSPQDLTGSRRSHILGGHAAGRGISRKTEFP